jgi:hypothetical protein
MKPDARELFLFIADGGNGLKFAEQYPDRIHMNRIVSLCYRWADRGWIDFGVTARTGWITDKGLEKAKELREQGQQ